MNKLSKWLLTISLILFLVLVTVWYPVIYVPGQGPGGLLNPRIKASYEFGICFFFAWCIPVCPLSAWMVLAVPVLGGVLGRFRKSAGRRVAAERRKDGGSPTASDVSLAPWYRIWLLAFFRPTPDTIAVLVRGHDRNRNAPYLWLFFSYTIGYGLWFVPSSLGQTDLGVMSVFGAPLVIGIGSMIIARVLVAIIQFIARRLLGGEGISSELFYIYAAMDSPGRLIRGLISLLSLVLPVIGYLGWVVMIYELVLLAIAIKVINRFSWSKAIIAVFPVIAPQICNLL